MTVFAVGCGIGVIVTAVYNAWKVHRVLDEMRQLGKARDVTGRIPR